MARSFPEANRPASEPDKDKMIVLHNMSIGKNANKYYIMLYWSKEGVGLKMYGRLNDEVPDAPTALKMAIEGRKAKGAQVKIESLSWYDLQEVVSEKTNPRNYDGKPYSVLDLAKKADVQALAVPEVKLVRGKDVTMQDIVRIDPKIQRLLKFIGEQADTRINQYLGGAGLAALSTAQIQSAKAIVNGMTPFIDRATVLGGNGLVDVNWTKLNLNERETFADQVEAYYNRIPTQLGRKIDKDQLMTDFAKQVRLGEIEDRLQQLQTALQSMIDPNDKAANVQQQNALIKQHQAMNAIVVPLQQSATQYGQIADHIHQTRPHQKIQDIYLIQVQGERERWNASTRGKNNVHTMFHGTQNSNVRHILNTGLIIPNYAANGSRMGRGIYHSDAAERSYGYTGTSGSNRNEPKMMFLSSVAIGKPWTSSGSDSSLKEAPKGYDSTHGIGSWSGRGDEYITYTLEQSTLRAIVLLD